MLDIFFILCYISSAVKITVLALEKRAKSPKGGKKMNKYELMFIVASDVAEEKREELIAKQKAYVEAHKGNVEGIERIGMKKLAYPINFKNEGFYVLMNIELPSQEVDAMSKLMNITDGIVRHIFVKKIVK